MIGETLAGPFNEAKAKLDDFRPSTLLAPLSDELARQKVRLKAEAAPSRALAPLITAFDGLLAQIDRLSPDAIIGPLEEAVESAIQDAVDASPIDEIFAEINGVFATVQGVLDTVTSIGTTVQKLGQALTALQDSDAQIDAWRDGILAKIDTAPNTADLNSVLGEIRDVVDATRHADLLAAYDAAVAPLGADLTGLTAGEQLSAMVALHQRLRPLVQALPAGPPRSAIEAVVARFDPLNPAHTGGLRAASDLATALSAGRAALTALQADFSGPLHGPGAGLTVLREAATDAGGLRAIVAADVDGALMPVRYLLAKLGAAAVPVGGVAQSLADLETRLTTSLANILTGPASLQSISDAVQSVVNTFATSISAFYGSLLKGCSAQCGNKWSHWVRSR